MSRAVFILAVAAVGILASAPADARARGKASRATTAYDGAWSLSFNTRAGACDPSYQFNVNIVRGVISHPNLVRFHGRVAKGGAAYASVTVQDKSASGSGRLSQTSGRGTWRGTSGGSRCSGDWTAQRS